MQRDACRPSPVNDPLHYSVQAFRLGEGFPWNKPSLIRSNSQSRRHRFSSSETVLELLLRWVTLSDLMSAIAPPPFLIADPTPQSPEMPARFGPVCLLLTEAFPPHAGGSRIYYYNLFRRLALRSHFAVVVSTTTTDGYRSFDIDVNTGYFTIVRSSSSAGWSMRRLCLLLPALIRAMNLCHQKAVTQLHAGDLFPQGLLCIALSKLLRIPFIAYAHGEEITLTDVRRFQPKLRDLIYQQAALVIAANNFAHLNLIRIGVRPEKIHTIPPGVDCSRFRPAAPPRDLMCRFGLEGKTVMLSVGRLVPHKGHELLLHAMAALPPLAAPLHYLVAGLGPERDRLEALAQRLGLSGRVTFIGRVQDAELPTLYNLCTFFALANREVRGEMEGFGMVFLEANASGKPVIGGRSGGVEHAVIDRVTGLLFDPSDHASLSKTLLEMCTDSALRDRLGRQGRERALRYFSWDQASDNLASACSAVLADFPRDACL